MHNSWAAHFLRLLAACLISRIHAFMPAYEVLRTLHSLEILSPGHLCTCILMFQQALPPTVFFSHHRLTCGRRKKSLPSNTDNAEFFKSVLSHLLSLLGKKGVSICYSQPEGCPIRPWKDIHSIRKQWVSLYSASLPCFYFIESGKRNFLAQSFSYRPMPFLFDAR